MAGKKKVDGAPTTESICTNCGKAWTGRMRWHAEYGCWRPYSWCVPCVNEAARRRKAGLPPVRNHPNCQECGVDITDRPSRSRFCSVECRTKNYAPTQVLMNRKGQLRFRYRMTPARYAEMVAAQDGVCAICRRPPQEGKLLEVDHDHSCCSGKKTCGRCVRQLLCHRCNTLLAMVDDDVALLAEVIAYLQGLAGGEGDLGLPA